jgi:hypothetical protein
MKFSNGEKVNVIKEGKWKGQNVHVFGVHTIHDPTLYSVRTNEGKELAFYETEVQSMYQHDIAMLKLWNEQPK